MIGSLCLLWSLCVATLNDSIDFESQIIPALTKAGCNGGACHGAAAGRGGFRLSLFGSDPNSDYESIVLHFEGRRVNQHHPEKSLLLRKPLGQLDHGGGTVLEEDSDEARKLIAWIAASAPRGIHRKLTGLVANPEQGLVSLEQRISDSHWEVPLRIDAQFDSGEWIDVTDQAALTVSEGTGVSTLGNRKIRLTTRGVHVVIARFLDRVAPIQIRIPYADVPVDLSEHPRQNYLDDAVLKTLTEMSLEPSPSATDGEFIRRVSLDLTGRLPSIELAKSFVASKHPDKRLALVDTLLASDAFVDYWTFRFSRILNMHAIPNEPEAMQAYYQWLRDAMRNEVGIDAMVRQLIMEIGDSHRLGAANFGRMVNDARSHAELVGQAFMGVQLGCANCHNHPLDRWTQDDFHGLASVFAKLDRKREVRLLKQGQVTNLRTNEPAIPKIPGGDYLSQAEDHRQAVAHWLVNGEDQFLAKSTVNRLWKHMFGRGLVEPVDDMRQTNPATHPELLNRLAEDFKASGFQIRHTLRTIAMSHTYATSSIATEANRLDRTHYAYSETRPLGPEVLLDAFCDVLEVPSRFEGHAVGARAIECIDPLEPIESLDMLGRCKQLGRCGVRTGVEDSISGRLHLLNGDTLNAKISEPGSALHVWIGKGMSDQEIVENIFWRSFSRDASEQELSFWMKRLETNEFDERIERLEDFVWSVLSCRAFTENH